MAHYEMKINRRQGLVDFSHRGAAFFPEHFQRFQLAAGRKDTHEQALLLDDPYLLVQ
jgi:hypothetical protein